jgi:hypothetical protein
MERTQGVAAATLPIEKEIRKVSDLKILMDKLGHYKPRLKIHGTTKPIYRHSFQKEHSDLLQRAIKNFTFEL